MADGSIKIKLAVDRARNRVLFADAGSDNTLSTCY